MKNRRKNVQGFVPGPRHRPGWTRARDGKPRWLDVITLGISREVFGDLYHALLSTSWRNFLLCVLGWYVTANLLFASLYFAAGPAHLEGLRATQGPAFFAECFFFSVQTLATIGYGRISPGSLISNATVSVEALFSILSVAMITGLLFARFSRPTARVFFSNNALVTMMDGLPCLNFRVSNARANHVVEANIAVSVLMKEVTKEGQSFRNWFDLKLERSHTPLLAMTWTVVHPIDEASPFHGWTLEQMQEDNVQIFVTLWGIDENLGQTIYSRYLYRAGDLVWNATFVDMIQINGDRILVDRAKLHDYVPV